jgi:glucokinase
VGARPAVGGRASESPGGAAVLGLDIGGTKLAAGVVDRSGRVRSFAVAPTDAERGPLAALDRLVALGRRVVGESGLDWADIGAVGIGCGGPLDSARGVLLAPLHLPGWTGVPITDLIEEAYARPATLENDATAGAAAEYRYGAGVGTRNMVYLTISTGVGGGVVLDGRLFRGTTGNGGELGHVTVDWHGRPCRGCGRLGCLEAYVSGTSIAERGREAGLEIETASEVVALAAAGDPVARSVWAETVEALACGVTSIVNLFEPERVVIGGGVSRAGERLIAPVRERVLASALAPAGHAVDIVQSALGETVGVVGAAAVAGDRVELVESAPHG